MNRIDEKLKFLFDLKSKINSIKNRLKPMKRKKMEVYENGS